MPENRESIDKKLDEIALKQLVWKNEKLLTACLTICEGALKSPGWFWPDEVTFDFLLTDEDRNCIGSAWRMCAKTLQIIEKTGEFKRSTREGQNGRVIFCYRLINQNIALAFMKRYNIQKYRDRQHPQLGLDL